MKRWLMAAAIAILVALLWGATTDDTRVWPARNTLQYRVMMAWWERAGFPQAGEPGSLTGALQGPAGEPIPGARLLLTAWDGRRYATRAEPDGGYLLEGIPAGRYALVAGAPGYADVARVGWRGVTISAGETARADVALPLAEPVTVQPGANLTLTERAPLSCDRPLQSQAARQTLAFDSGGAPNQMTFLYTPVTLTADSRVPTLLAIYPGPADEWECTSVPLAEAGYAVIAASPTYSLDLERDVDELQRLVAFARAGDLPGADGSRMAALGGSYSALLVQRLLQRDPTLDASVQLGPPSDLFEMRRLYEEGTFVPPFGLDQLLVALGFPDREPLRYWQYSGAYHASPALPPIALFHSLSDEVVPHQQSELLAESLRQEGVEHELHFFDGGSHYLLDADSDALEIYRLTLAFLERHLK